MKQSHKTIGHRAAVVASLVVTSLALSACSGAEPSTTTKPTIVWGTQVSDSQRAVETKIVKACGVEAGANVTIQVTPFSNYDTKLSTALKGGDAPDVFRINWPNVQIYHNAGYLADLSKPIAAGTIKTSELIPGLVAIGTLSGGQYSLPNDTDGRALYYSPKLFKQAGIVDDSGNALPPETWSDLVADVKKFNPDSGVYGFSFQQQTPYSALIEAVGPFLKASNGTVVSGAKKPESVASKDASSIAAMQLLQNIVKTGSVPPGLSNMQDTTQTNLFAAGKLAMFTGGPWDRGQILDANPSAKYGVDYATAVIPVQKAGEASGTSSGGWENGINAKSKHLEQDYKFLNCMESPKNLLKQASTGSFPPLKDGMNQPPFSKDPFWSAYKKMMPKSGTALPAIPQLNQYCGDYQAAFQEIVLQNKPVKSTLRDFDAKENGQVLN